MPRNHGLIPLADRPACPTLDSPVQTDAAYKDNFMDVVRKTAHLNDSNTIDISPGPVATIRWDQHSTGHLTNPVTGQADAPNPVIRGDFTRVLAEFWADGPNSETPPGHWHVLANQVADDPQLVKRIGVRPP